MELKKSKMNKLIRNLPIGSFFNYVWHGHKIDEKKGKGPGKIVAKTLAHTAWGLGVPAYLLVSLLYQSPDPRVWYRDFKESREVEVEIDPEAQHILYDGLIPEIDKEMNASKSLNLDEIVEK